MELAQLSKRVEIQKRIQDRNVLGELSYGYDAFCFRWANIRPIKAKSEFLADADQPKTTYEITLRYDSTTKQIDEFMRIVGPGEQLFRIVGIVNKNMRNEFLILSCIEYKADSA